MPSLTSPRASASPLAFREPACTAGRPEAASQPAQVWLLRMGSQDTLGAGCWEGRKEAPGIPLSISVP